MLIKITMALCVIAIVFGYLIIETFNEGNVFERRKRQNKKMLKENIVRKKISEFAVKKVKITKRMKDVYKRQSVKVEGRKVGYNGGLVI